VRPARPKHGWCWRPGPKSSIYAGLKPGATEGVLRQALANGEVADRLACFAPKPGDGVFIPAGTVHSLGGDIVVFEIQQNSDVTFRLYDWNHVDAKTGKPRALQVDQALACIDFGESRGRSGGAGDGADYSSAARKTLSL
jgi:mannose-6-phosphate isomerase